MAHFKIHPIVMGTKIFNKSMMTYQYGYGETYTIPIYAWYIEGSEKTIVSGISVMHTSAHTKGGMTVLIDTAQGSAAITGFCVVDENINPPVVI